MRHVDITIYGFPVTVVAAVHPPEPDIGIFERQVDIHNITTRTGKPLELPNLTVADYEHICEEILNAC